MATALLVVDVQTALTDWLAAERRRDFLATLRELIARARAAGIPVVYVRHGDEEDLIAGTAGWEITARIAPRPDEPIVDKRFRDAFRETTLAGVLERRSVERLVVCGMQSEFCVDATIREAERRGYRVTLVSDGHATYSSDDLSEEQIRGNVHRIARGEVAEIVAAEDLFVSAAT